MSEMIIVLAPAMQRHPQISITALRCPISGFFFIYVLFIFKVKLPFYPHLFLHNYLHVGRGSIVGGGAGVACPDFSG